MSRPLENPLTFRSLYDSPLVSVRDYRCRIGCGAPGDEEQPDADQIVLLRYGAFRKHFGRRSVTADVNQAVFFSKESSYRVSHPADCGDRGTIFIASPRVLNDIVRELDPTTEADHADRVEAAKTYLATRMSERVTLDDIARAVGVSPFHLARLFQQRTGAPVHRYLMCLRLRASLERLADGANDLTALALELGFSSHSHFTDSFRREFGRTPSDVRRGASRRGLREMSKNLEV